MNGREPGWLTVAAPADQAGGLNRTLVAAGIEVGKPGVATVSVEELLAAYDAD